MAGGAAGLRGSRPTTKAAGTRAHIVATAGRLFDTNGYVRTTIDAVADEAGVALQTVYNSVGNKTALLSAVLDAAASGPGARQVLELMRERARNAPDLDSQARHRVGQFPGPSEPGTT